MASARKTIIAGNWKMFKTRAEARALANELADGIKSERVLPEIVLCPPFTSLAEVKETVGTSGIKVGAQNMEYRMDGAFTGEISPLMLADIGVDYVLIGHSERRQYYGETNATVNSKLKAALKQKFVPIVCVGESLAEREGDRTDTVIRSQVSEALADLTAQELAPLVVAYEPVWAIGTGKNCDAKEANRVAALIRKTIDEVFSGSNLGQSVPVLYGGSVKPSTIEEQMQQPDIDGALVGGASLKAEEFLPIIRGGAKRVQLATAK